MRAVSKLRVVTNCPQPEVMVKPVMYGAAPWSRLPHNPTADEITLRARAQSLMSRGGVRAELPDIETARRVLASPAAADAARQPSPAGDPPYAARGGESVPRNYSTIEEWDAYYEGRAPKPEHPPF